MSDPTTGVPLDDPRRLVHRETLRAMSDDAVAYQMVHGAKGGIQREEIMREFNRRAQIEVGRFTEQELRWIRNTCQTIIDRGYDDAEARSVLDKAIDMLEVTR